MHKIAIFASGAGSNAKEIINRFRGNNGIKVDLIVCNKPNAGVIHIAGSEEIPVLVLEKEKFFEGNAYLDELSSAGITFIVLAGFLWKIPARLVKAYHRKIVNIHPALLPAYGGKGMYGQYVHEAVLSSGEKESGITVHYVDDQYDHGKIIFQARCKIDIGETADSLAAKIHRLEHRYYARVIEKLLAAKEA